MIKPNPVVEALETAKRELNEWSDPNGMFDNRTNEAIASIEKALPLAREMAEKLDRYERTSESGESLGGEMEYREALEWLIKLLQRWKRSFVRKYILGIKDCPAIIEKMIEEGK